MIETRSLDHDFPLGGVKVPALRQVSTRIETGEFVIIAGPSGSGKTTFLNTVGLILKPTRGLVLWDGEDVYSKDEHKLATLRRMELGFIFQTFNLIPVLTVTENVEYFLLKKAIPAVQAREWVESVLTTVGLKDHMKKYPWQLSGGQRQRVAIARALVKRPRVLLADEPTANLDHATGMAIVELLKKLNQEEKTTVIIASHDPKVIKSAPRILNFEDGRVSC